MVNKHEWLTTNNKINNYLSKVTQKPVSDHFVNFSLNFTFSKNIR